LVQDPPYNSYKNRTNIIVITNANFPFGGSSANYIRLLAIGLKKNANKVKVLLPSGHSYGCDVEQNIKRKGVIDGVNYKSTLFLNHPKKIFGKIINALFSNLFLIFNLVYFRIFYKYKIVIKYDTFFLRDISILAVTKILNARLISIIPDFFEKSPRSILSFNFFNWFSFHLGLKYVTKYSDKIIVFSYFLREYFNYSLKYLKPILVVPNLTDPANFRSSESQIFCKDIIRIGFLGSPTKKDGIIDLIDSFKIVNEKFKNTHLVCIGDLPNGTSVVPTLKEYADKNNISDNITFTGLVSFTKIPGLLKECDLCVLARPDGKVADAGFPSKLGEYFACKKPVVITEVGGIKNYFKHKHNAILVEPGNPESIASGMKYLISNPEKAKKIGEEGFNWMISNLEYTKVTTKIFGFINS